MCNVRWNTIRLENKLSFGGTLLHILTQSIFIAVRHAETVLSLSEIGPRFKKSNELFYKMPKI